MSELLSDKIIKLKSDVSTAYKAIAKKGSTFTGDQVIKNLSTAINAIPSGGSTIKTIDYVVTSNNDYTINAIDYDADGLDCVNLNVNVPVPTIGVTEAEYTKAGTYIIDSSTIGDVSAYSKITVTVNCSVYASDKLILPILFFTDTDGIIQADYTIFNNAKELYNYFVIMSYISYNKTLTYNSEKIYDLFANNKVEYLKENWDSIKSIIANSLSTTNSIICKIMSYTYDGGFQLGDGTDFKLSQNIPFNQYIDIEDSTYIDELLKLVLNAISWVVDNNYAFVVENNSDNTIVILNK